MTLPDRSARVAIVHPWMPHYRVRFFELLRETLAGSGVELLVAHGSDPHFAQGRGDEAELGWATRLPEAHLSIRGSNVTLRRPWGPALSADLLIVEDGLRNVDTYAYLAARRLRRDRPTAFWGHGRTMDRPAGGRARRLKERLLRSGDWWFAYTAGSAAHLRSIGIPAERITDVGNTIDTASLREAAANPDVAAIDSLRSGHGLTAGHTALFIGGLSATKNIPALIESARAVADRDPLFRLLVAGDGPDRELVEHASRECAAIRPLGPVLDAPGKAALGAVSDFMVLPGLTGLAIVDAFALGLPPIAVSPWDHAPEFEYLDDGSDCLVVEPTSAALAEAIGTMIDDPTMRERLAAGCLRKADGFTVEAMVERFSSGVLAALAAGRAGRPAARG